ncbi:hypothetical protein PR202_ga24469 [Eleusine coracana subsp. coracana]|uniref:Uncharacterized protein n=1 Tax=Eleusine coracana subsp. coracana TaxID=191504 RepID=A0AAV5D965_ELECO|nr:hypothetical protein PR202_ga24469 [Eleusine coracana subsp. coracana]
MSPRRTSSTRSRCKSPCRRPPARRAGPPRRPCPLCRLRPRRRARRVNGAGLPCPTPTGTRKFIPQCVRTSASDPATPRRPLSPSKLPASPAARTRGRGGRCSVPRQCELWGVAFFRGEDEPPRGAHWLCGPSILAREMVALQLRERKKFRSIFV